MEENNSWLKKAIAQGFMMLSALNLKGRPASTDLTAVAELWLGILGGRNWQPERDGMRIQTAFKTIAASQSQDGAEAGKETQSDGVRQSTSGTIETETGRIKKRTLHGQGMDTRAETQVGG